MSKSRTSGSASALVFALALASGAEAGTVLLPGSLIISETTYSDRGAVAGLTPGVTKLPGKNAGQTVSAVANGNLLQVFNNANVDGSFGVTSAITLQALSVAGTSGSTVLSTLNINPNLVSTSFSSKSELGLNIAYTANGAVVTFMGYAGGGVGNLDVSNSDTIAYQDNTNPVTTTFGKNGGPYAFNRAVVAVSQNGSVTSTQTLAYGGNNGRSAVLAPNGAYYTVGNSNNGSGTPSQLTTSTGLEVVTPGSTPNSTMVDPSYKSIAGDKAGKDSNFRGLTLFNGNLYFTKGSGSNGIDTVYEVQGTPTAANAANATISILPGFSTSPAKTAADFTPFGLFFANSTTLYVADEGSGDALDAGAHAGLEKWSLVNGTWRLDYTLQDNLIGDTYTLDGVTVTTSGLRNLSGRINANGTITLFATTADTGGFADNGADPNEIVEINDTLADTTLPTNESFSVVDGPVLGVRYGGVAFDAAVPEPATWAMLILGVAGVGAVLRRRGALVTA
jgi:hypothetical protein